MRGGARAGRRAGNNPNPPQEVPARIGNIPAPSGGWNARGNLANMKPTEAIVLDNIFPGVQDVMIRKGSTAWSTGYSENIKSLMTYNGPVQSKLFACTNVGIYDATNNAPVGAAVASCTSGFWKYVNFANSGGAWLVAVNGVDNLKLYNGTTWTTVTGVSVPAITGIATTSFTQIALHKKRVWFVEGGSMNLWYLGIDAVSGAATMFPVGGLFKRGGKVVSIGSLTLDGGAGQDDYFVIVTSKGEMAVYQGTDPTASTTWALVGVFDIGLPVGDRPLADFGGDMLYLTHNGVFPLSKLAQSAVLDRSQTITFKIDAAFLEYTQQFGGNDGWQMQLFKTQNFLIVNVPISEDTIAYQFVMNTITGAWCRFTGWNASCWETLGTELYFAGGTSVRKAWQGANDEDSAIAARVATAYTAQGYGGQKIINIMRLNASVSGSITVNAAVDSDFKAFPGQSIVSYVGVAAEGLWDSGLWDSTLWDSGENTIEPKWTTVPNEPGYMHSLRMELTTSNSNFLWTTTNTAFTPCGIL